MIRTIIGVTRPGRRKSSASRAQQRVDRAHADSTLRCPMRSPVTPNIGAISVPKYCSAPNTVSQQHRTGLDQHVPAEDQRLHLERPRGEQIGRPLEPEARNPEWREHRRPRAVRVHRFALLAALRGPGPVEHRVVAGSWSPGKSDLSGSGDDHDRQNRMAIVRTRCCAATQLSPLIPAKSGIQSQRTGSPRSRGRAD